MKASVLAAIAALALTQVSGIALAQERGGVIDVATIGEPPTLDPMASTADLVGIITQHVFETLYTFDETWNVTPLLAEDMPTIGEDGRVYEIRLREGVTFHDGSTMSADDAVASLERWMRIATRGRQAAAVIESVEAKDERTIVIRLNAPYAPLAALLAFNNAAAIVIPAANAAQEPLSDIVGTGPYRLEARVPDQYIQLVRFEDYAARDGEPDGYGGARKQFLDEIRFVPVPDPNTRIEGAVAGQFAYVDALPVEAYPRIASGATEPLILAPFGWPVFVMNTKEGLASDLRIRKAVQAALAPEDMMLAAFGSEEFFEIDGAWYPRSHVWHTQDGTEPYRPEGDTEAARAHLAEAGYDGTPLRILTSRQYEFHYKMAEVAQAYLQAAGFTVEMDVVEWATLTQRRADPALWDVFITHSPFLPEPSLMGIMSDTSPGWWSSPAKTAALEAFNTQSDREARIALFADVQRVIYEEAPAFKVGNFNALAAKAPNLEGVVPAPWPYFWNAYLR